MALPTSPPISLNQIKAEFGATGARSLTEFYRGGAFVPNIPANSGVPTSGAISILDFLGAIAMDANWVNQSAIDFVMAGGIQNAVAELSVMSNGGTSRSTTQEGYVVTGTWLLAGSASDYSVRAVHTGGDIPYGSLSTWLPLSSTRTWGVTAASGLVSGTLAVTLRHNPSGTTWSANYNMSATKGVL